MRALTIGKLAKNAGVNLETIRYYERIGLMPKPARTAGGHRNYDDEHVRRLRFIRRARELGFTIEDVRALLKLAEPGQGTCTQVEMIAGAHLKNVKAKIKDLAKLERILARSVARCRAGTSATCPVLDVLKN